MARSKNEEFTQANQELAAVAKALSHPARVAILRLLAARKSCVCGELVDSLPLSQSTVSQHLKELKTAGLIQGEIAGPRTCYCLSPAGWDKARLLLSALLTDIPAVSVACEC